MPTDIFVAVRLQHGAEHLHKLGVRDRRTARRGGNRIGGMTTILTVLGEYQSLTPQVLRAVGGDKFPRRIRAVPR